MPPHSDQAPQFYGSPVMQLATFKSIACTWAAVLYLDAVLARLRAAASSEWAVLQWVLRVSNVHATRHFKCLWETEQPGLVQPWVVSDQRGKAERKLCKETSDVAGFGKCKHFHRPTTLGVS
eukprot:scaffold77180_cov23-Tisochrysis_lutea.AAC.1